MTTLSRNPRLGGILAVVGSVLLLLSGLLSWSYEPILGDISVRFWPVTLQVYAMVIGAVALLLALVASGPFGRWAEHIDPARGLRTIGVTGVLFALASLIAVTLASSAWPLAAAEQGALRTFPCSRGLMIWGSDRTRSPGRPSARSLGQAMLPGTTVRICARSRWICLQIAIKSSRAFGNLAPNASGISSVPGRFNSILSVSWTPLSPSICRPGLKISISPYESWPPIISAAPRWTSKPARCYPLLQPLFRFQPFFVLSGIREDF